jgi:hypothetical protein
VEIPDVPGLLATPQETATGEADVAKALGLIGA